MELAHRCEDEWGERDVGSCTPGDVVCALLVEPHVGSVVLGASLVSHRYVDADHRGDMQDAVGSVVSTKIDECSNGSAMGCIGLGIAWDSNVRRVGRVKDVLDR